MITETDIFRSEGCIRRYRERRKVLGASINDTDLTKLPLVKEWELWVLVKNEFPYDKIAEDHCMLVPKRKFCDDMEMIEEERWELWDIKKEFSKDRLFDLMCESMQHDKSVTGVFHLHCLRLKYRTPIPEL